MRVAGCLRKAPPTLVANPPAADVPKILALLPTRPAARTAKSFALPAASFIRAQWVRGADEAWTRGGTAEDDVGRPSPQFLHLAAPSRFSPPHTGHWRFTSAIEGFLLRRTSD